MLNQEKEIPSHHYVKLGLAIVVIFQLVMLFMYGFFTSYTTIVYTTRLEYILTNALAVLGFGLLLIYFRFAIKQTIIVALIVCAVNCQMGPLLQQFWYNVFVQGFYKSLSYTAATFPYKMIVDTGLQDVKNITLGFVRISTYCSISLLVALSGVIGKIGMVNTLLAAITFNIGFNLNYYLNFLIYYKQGSDAVTYFIMDDFQGSRVFMFGAGFGLALLLIYKGTNKVIRSPKGQYSDTLSCFLSLLGTCFILALFYFVLDTYIVLDKSLALLNIYFAFSSSIVSSIAISCIISGYITFHQINMSVISGVIQISIIGAFIQTPYVALLVGAFAGIVTGLLSHFVHSRINNNQFVDSKGIIVIYLINCVFCSYFICPIIIKAYENALNTLNYNEGFHMIYTSISFGIGLAFGFLASIFRCCIKEENNLSDIDFFSSAYMERKVPKPRPVQQTPFQEAHTQEKLFIQKSHLKQITPPLEISL